jgi:hypothetical protein
VPEVRADREELRAAARLMAEAAAGVREQEK